MGMASSFLGHHGSGVSLQRRAVLQRLTTIALFKLRLLKYRRAQQRLLRRRTAISIPTLRTTTIEPAYLRRLQAHSTEPPRRRTIRK